MVVPKQRAGSHALLTRAPLGNSSENKHLVRLACVKRAASVRSEPGSNSQLEPSGVTKTPLMIQTSLTHISKPVTQAETQITNLKGVDRDSHHMAETT